VRLEHPYGWIFSLIEVVKLNMKHSLLLGCQFLCFLIKELIFVTSCLFPVAIRLARGNTIALAPSVLGSLYKDLSLFKKQIVDLKKCSDKFP
jgi:hypothetical protein